MANTSLFWLQHARWISIRNVNSNTLANLRLGIKLFFLYFTLYPHLFRWSIVLKEG